MHLHPSIPFFSFQYKNNLNNYIISNNNNHHQYINKKIKLNRWFERYYLVKKNRGITFSYPSLREDPYSKKIIPFCFIGKNDIYSFCITTEIGEVIYGVVSIENNISRVILSKYNRLYLLEKLLTILIHLDIQRLLNILKFLWIQPPKTNNIMIKEIHIEINNKSELLDPLFTLLDSRRILFLFASLINERRIIICSDNVNQLTSSVWTAVKLLQPFNWQNIFIPIIPDQLVDTVNAPTPYILGLHSNNIPILEQMQLSDLVFVDLRNNRIEGLDPADLATIPPSLATNIIRGIKKIQELNRKTEEFPNPLKLFRNFFDTIFNGYNGNLTKFKKSKNSKVRRFLRIFETTQMFERWNSKYLYEDEENYQRSSPIISVVGEEETSITAPTEQEYIKEIVEVLLDTPKEEESLGITTHEDTDEKTNIVRRKFMNKIQLFEKRIQDGFGPEKVLNRTGSIGGVTKRVFKRINSKSDIIKQEREEEELQKKSKNEMENSNSTTDDLSTSSDELSTSSDEDELSDHQQQQKEEEQEDTVSEENKLQSTIKRGQKPLRRHLRRKNPNLDSSRGRGGYLNSSRGRGPPRRRGIRGIRGIRGRITRPPRRIKRTSPTPTTIKQPQVEFPTKIKKAPKIPKYQRLLMETGSWQPPKRKEINWLQRND